VNIEPGLIIAIAFPILFVGIWVMVLFLVSILGGWSKLGKHYPDDPDVQRRSKSWKSGRLGWVGYNNCLTIGISDEGLHLSMPFPFRFSHPSLMIPWDQFHKTERKSRFGFQGTGTHIEQPVGVRLTLPAFVYDELIERESEFEYFDE